MPKRSASVVIFSEERRVAQRALRSIADSAGRNIEIPCRISRTTAAGASCIDPALFARPRKK